MAWEIGNFEESPDGTVHITKLLWSEGGRIVDAFPVNPAMSIPPAGPSRNAAIAALKAVGEGLRNRPPRPDMTAIEALLNSGN